jgi:hypothetical protein
VTRPSRVYRLDIIYPEGSRQPGWRPASYDDPRYLATLTRRQRREHLARPFRWPRERQFLSSSGAYGRAGLLRWWGADVEVYASDPVTWPNPYESVRWECSDMARWHPGLEEHDLGNMPLPEAEFERMLSENEAKARQVR